MKKQERITLAKRFVAGHKNNRVTDWVPVGTDDDGKHIIIYNNLVSGKYGDVSDSAIMDFEYLSIEISSNESKSGNAFYFEWKI